MNRYLQSIDNTGDETAVTIQKEHASELEVVYEALDHILRGLSDFGSRKQKPDNKLESARLFLATRSFNSIRIAMIALERGYYQQASALVRMAMEDRLVARDIENHRPTLDALLGGEGKLGTFGKMAERVSPKAKEVWDIEYGWLSKFAAHTRYESMRGLVVTGTDGQTTLGPGGRYDKIEVMAGLYSVLRMLVFNMEIVTKVTYSAGIDWIVDAMPVFKKVEALLQEIDDWASEQIEDSQESTE